MHLRRFVRLLEAYGGDPTRWPRRDVPESIVPLIAASAEARESLRRAEALDRALAGTAVGPDAATLRRMHSAVAVRIACSPLPSPGGAMAAWLEPLFQVGLGALATLAVCVVWLAWRGFDGPIDLLASPPALIMAETRL